MPVIASTTEEEAAFAEGNPLPEPRPTKATPATRPTLAALFGAKQPGELHGFIVSTTIGPSAVYVQTFPVCPGDDLTEEEAFAQTVEQAHAIAPTVDGVMVIAVRKVTRYASESNRNSDDSALLGSVNARGEWTTLRSPDR